MKRLSKTQATVLQECVEQCVECRTLSLTEYLQKAYSDSRLLGSYSEWVERWGEYETKSYKTQREGQIFLVGVNKRTIAKLVELGYINKVKAYHENEIVWLNLEKCGIK